MSTRRLISIASLGRVLSTSERCVDRAFCHAVAKPLRGAGPVWPLLVPFVGVLGTFVTGNMIAPMNLLAGAATVGLVGREG